MKVYLLCLDCETFSQDRVLNFVPRNVAPTEVSVVLKNPPLCRGMVGIFFPRRPWICQAREPSIWGGAGGGSGFR